MGPLELDILGQNGHHDFHGMLAFEGVCEGESAAEELVEQHAQGPHVALQATGLHEGFGGHIQGCAALLLLHALQNLPPNDVD